MFDRKLGVAILCWGFWGLASMASAQDYSAPGPPPPADSRPIRPFGGFFEDIGHSLFGSGEQTVRDDRVVPPSQTVPMYDAYGRPVNAVPPPRVVGVRTVPGPVGNAADLPDEPPAGQPMSFVHKLRAEDLKALAILKTKLKGRIAPHLGAVRELEGRAAARDDVQRIGVEVQRSAVEPGFGRGRRRQRAERQQQERAASDSRSS